MLQCLSFKSTSATSPSLPTSPAAANINLNSHPPLSEGNSTDGTPRSSTQQSPTVNLTREYTLNVQTDSYNEMWSRIHVYEPDQDHLVKHQSDPNGDSQQLLLSRVLHPNRQCVEETLSRVKPNTFTRLVSAYFDHSEETTNLCLLLYQNIHRARKLYEPLDMLLEVLPYDQCSITQSQCDWAFDVFLDFDRSDNPFPSPDSRNFHEMRCCFSQLRQQLDRRLRKSQSRVRILRRATAGSALCVIGTVVGVAVSAAVIATHALVAIVAGGPICSAYLPRDFKKKERTLISQLDAAAKFTFVLNSDLDTIGCLSDGLHTAIEGDKLLIRLGLDRGRDKYAIQEVVKQLSKNHLNFIDQLKNLEEHICLCFNTVNRARSLLLQKIHLPQTSSS